MHISEIKSRMQSGYRGFPLNRPGDPDGWYEDCQALVRWTYEMINDRDPIRYLSARAAWNDSPDAVSKDPYAAPPGALHFFTAGHSDYDVKISLGGGRILHAYKKQQDMWGNNLGVDEWEYAASIAPWMRTTYLGWVYGEGPGGMYRLDIQVDTNDPALPEEEDEEMRYFMIRYTEGGEDRVKIYQTSSGFEYNYETRSTAVNNKYMEMYGVDKIHPVDESEFNRKAASLAAVRQGK